MTGIISQDIGIRLDPLDGFYVSGLTLGAAEGGDSYTGSAIITNYTESSSADPDTDTTVGLDLQISGAFTKVTG